MTYGTIKVDTVTFTDAGIDKSVTFSGLIQNPIFSGNVTVTGTLSGVTVTGTTANFTSGNFTNISGGTHTITSGVFAAGSAASPSITFTGDLNTGIYSPGADQVAISTGGSGRLFVDASGNVGVATGAPSYRLEVNGTISQSSQGTSSALIQAVNAGGIFYHGLDNSAGTTFGQAYAAALWHSGAYPILFATNGTERLRITSAGLVGIGTSSPTTNVHIGSGVGGADLGVLLSRGATTNFFEAHDGTKNFIAGTDSSNAFVKVGSLTNHPVAIVQSNAAAIYIDTSKRVGIGTTSPGVLLDVAGGNSIRVQASSSSISLPTGLALTTGFGVSYLSSFDGSGNAVDFGGVSANFIWSADTHRFTNRPATTEYARIDSSGRVGIGTTSPGYALDARGAIASTSASGIQTVLSFASDGIVGTVSNHSLTFFANNGERARIDTSGRLLVGTSSARDPGGDSKIEAFNGPIAISTFANSAGFYGLNFVKSRGTSTNVIVQNNDSLSAVRFFGADGTAYPEAARIEAFVDGTPGTNDMPGRLLFYTTSDGGSFPTERMRIPNGGGLSVGSTVNPNALTQASGIRLGSSTIANHDFTNITTSPVNIANGVGIGGLAFVQAYNTANGAQYTGIVMWRANVVAVVSESNSLGFGLTYTVSGSALYLQTASGTISGSVITLAG
jgi:hypothetical protein